MKNPEIFPADISNSDGAIIVSIANFMQCTESDVYSAFRGVKIVEWATPEHLDSVKQVTHSFNDAARHAKNLHRALSRITVAQRNDLLVAGCITNFQIEHLADVLAQDAKSLADWSRTSIRTGGKNPAAYAVSEAMRRLFRRLRKDITFGQSPDGGPSTLFGRAVQFALGAYGIKADWRRPTQDARESQMQINRRYQAIMALRPRRELLEKPANVSIDTRRSGADLTYIFSVMGRPDIPKHEVCSCRFRSGLEVKDYAAKWLASFDTNS